MEKEEGTVLGKNIWLEVERIDPRHAAFARTKINEIKEVEQKLRKEVHNVKGGSKEQRYNLLVAALTNIPADSNITSMTKNYETFIDAASQSTRERKKSVYLNSTSVRFFIPNSASEKWPIPPFWNPPFFEYALTI